MFGKRFTRAAAFAVFMVMVLATQALAAASWGSVTSVTAAGSYAPYGNHLATTVKSGTRYIHELSTQDKFGSQYASDSGTHEGAMYQRLSSSGAKIGGPVRLSNPNEHGDRGSIAAAGANVYAVWHTIASFDNYSSADARLLRFRRNTSHGQGAWSPALVLTTTGRVDKPSIAASGSYVYILYVDADTGAIHLRVSANSGVSFPTDTVIGTTAQHDTSGYWADGSVAAAGANVAVVANINTDVTEGWVSTNHGASFPSHRDLTSHASYSTGSGSVAALGGRVAFAVLTPSGVRLYNWVGGAFSSSKTVAGVTSTSKWFEDVAVSLVGTSGIGVAWTACRYSDCHSTESPAKGADLYWRESVDKAAHWKTAKNIQTSTGTSASGKARRYNDFPSIVYEGTKRYVSWTAYNASDTSYQILLRIASGHP